jgi:hypothetical protein
VLAVVKFVSLPAFIGRCQFATEIGSLFNLWRPLIAPLIGFAISVESGRRLELKIVPLHAHSYSLADIFLNPPAWGAPTAKAKAVSEIARALQFGHGLELFLGGVKAGNDRFDADRRI